MRLRTSTGTQTAFSTVRSEGGLLPPDLLARITANESELGGFDPQLYDLAAGERLNEAIARAWERVKSYWAAFSAARQVIGAGETGVTETRELWLLQLFRELGFGRLTFRAAAEEIEGRRYPISHQAGESPASPPVHLVSFRTDLERLTTAGAGQPRTSPHGLLQEYLNRTDHLWGVVSNGLRLRLLRDNLRLSRAAYVEFDLEAMLDGGVYADFVLLYLLLHRSRFPQGEQPPASCWLERWRAAADERGKRALNELRDGVESAIRALGQGLVEHPENDELRQRLMSGKLSILDYYRQLLRLVYRLLFLLAAEERDLLFDGDAADAQRAIYARHYGVGRLRTLVEQRRHADRYDDLWRSLAITFQALTASDTGRQLGLKPLAGGLFGPDSCPDLDRALIANARLLEAIRGLSFTKAGKTDGIRRINYRDMDVEELGSVYEGLLELQPSLNVSSEKPAFDLGHSGERKSTGSYYTNPGLVRELIVSALEPVIAAALERGANRAEKRRNLLALNVCDPACGSGHFLLAAARRIGREIARLDAGESEPDPTSTRHATREAIANCVYGVDLNPLAVDLCKLALWLEAHEPGKPIGFLDHHIKQGNSLIGATAAVMANGIPDDVFEAVTGDDKKIAAALKKRNRQEKNQIGLDLLGTTITVFTSADEAAAYFRRLDASEDSVSDVEAKAREYRRHQSSPDAWRNRIQADLWTAAAFWPLQAGEPEAPTQATWLRLCSDPHLTDYIAKGKADAYRHTAAYRTVILARRLARRHSFFHWELEFEDVFSGDNSGFDCILGNPPWEQIQPEEQKFFAVRNPIIAAAAGATRKRMIDALPTSNQPLWDAWQSHVVEMEHISLFIRKSMSYPLTGTGKINTYPAFSERASMLVSEMGRLGIIVPTGIATDDTNKHFFGWLVENGRISSLFDFENREGLFDSVDSRMKFSLLTIRGKSNPTSPFSVAFFLTAPDQLREPDRIFELDANAIRLLNPNTRTCPIFRSARDAELTKRIYEAAPVLIREDEHGKVIDNPWGITLKQGLFNMTSDSHLFRTRKELQDRGLQLGEDSRFRGHGETWLPLYEAKMIHQYDHRFATYESIDGSERTRDVTLAEHQNPNYSPLPRYWVKEEEVGRAVGDTFDWLIGFRDIARNTDKRTAIFSIVPFAAVGHTLPVIQLEEASFDEKIALFGAFNSLVIDYAIRQKLSGTHLTFFIVKQLPLINRTKFTQSQFGEITPRVLELVRTSRDIESFGQQDEQVTSLFCWDELRRQSLRAELDGIYAHLYNLSRDDFAYILDTFPIVRQADEVAYGEYRTKRLCLEAYDRFEGIV